ncbi:unnamed protein product [Effrenium voratum]|nr:unnamed protein product [Effrenium voratum]
MEQPLNQAASGYSSVSSTHIQPKPRSRRGWFFPMQPFWIIGQCCPSLHASLPTHMRVIQSFPHLVLLVGTCTNAFLLVRAAEDASHYNDRHLPHVLVMSASAVFSVYCLWQLFREMVQYRHDLQERSTEIERLKDGLSLQFESTADELEALLNRSRDTKAAMAEQSLDSERRDFHRFLRNISPKLTAAPEGLLDPFRRFLCIWLQVMAECSLDPVGSPYSVIGEAEFRSLGAAALAQRLCQCLKDSEIRFIKDTVEENKKGVMSLKLGWKKMVLVQRKALKFTGLSRWGPNSFRSILGTQIDADVNVTFTR